MAKLVEVHIPSGAVLIVTCLLYIQILLTEKQDLLNDVHTYKWTDLCDSNKECD